MLADYHVHTQYSDDSDSPMEEVVQDALRPGAGRAVLYRPRGLWRQTGLGRPPRGPVPFPGGPGEPAQIPLANVDYPRYAAEYSAIKEIYRDQIDLRLGMEFGMQVHTIPQFQALFGRYPFDFIILSVHQVEDKEFWTQDFQRGRTQEEYQQRYYEEIWNWCVSTTTTASWGILTFWAGTTWPDRTRLSGCDRS